jgi:hypothetical protein
MFVFLALCLLSGCRVPTGLTDRGDASDDDGGDGDGDGDSDSDSDFDPFEECGEADYTGGALAIPDGLGIPYETTLTIEGFGEGATLESAEQIESVCVNMEHTWIRDLQIELESPSGEIVVLSEFLGREGSEVYLGEPDDSDTYDPNPGVGYDYCWTPTATNPPMLEYCNLHTPDTLPPGDYQASSGFDVLVGTALNGMWILRCIDDWGIDNGYIFSWSITFDSSLIPDCDEWIVY